jgi:hypothetical protein
MNIKVMKAEVDSNGNYIVVVRGWEGKENDPTFVLEDVIILNRQDIINEEIIKAILYGVQISENIKHQFSSNEVMVSTVDGNIKVEIIPSDDKSRDAYRRVIERAINSINTLSRKMITIAKERIYRKAGKVFIPDEEEKKIIENESKKVVNAERLKIFNLISTHNLDKEKVKKDIQAITGKNSSSEWNIDDIVKINKYLNQIINPKQESK